MQRAAVGEFRDEYKRSERGGVHKSKINRALTVQQQ